jgi:hypothetical protein
MLYGFLLVFVSRDSSVGIVTRYKLDGPAIESWWRMRFSVPVLTRPGAHPASYTMGTESFPWVRRPGHGVDHPRTSRAEVKNKSRPLPLLPIWAFVACSTLNFTSTLQVLQPLQNVASVTVEEFVDLKYINKDN